MPDLPRSLSAARPPPSPYPAAGPAAASAAPAGGPSAGPVARPRALRSVEHPSDLAAVAAAAPHHHGDAFLGVPDRSASASAPPDLEISSRSLFAFKADYSGIFSDIRMDEDYESFYNENPERQKLPPPLQPSSASPRLTRPARSAQDRLFSSLHDPPAPQLSSLRPRVPPASPVVAASSSAPAFAALAAAQHTHHPTPLRRDDSDASFEDLIFRESRSMRPTAATARFRDDDARADEEFRLASAIVARPPRRADKLPSPPPPPTPHHQHQQHQQHQQQQHSVPSRELNASPPLRVLSPQFVHAVRNAPDAELEMVRRAAESAVQQPQPQQPTLVTRQQQQQILASPSLERQPSPPPPAPQQTVGQQEHSPRRDQDHQAALWKLGQLSLDEASTATASSASVYPNAPGFDSAAMAAAIASPRSSYQSPTASYTYPQGPSTAQVPSAAAVAAAAAAAAAAQHTSSPPYGVQSHQSHVQRSHVQQSHQQQKWAQVQGGDLARKTPGGTYDGPEGLVSAGSSYAPPNGAMAEMFGGLQGIEDPLGAYEAASQAVSGMPYGSMGAYRENANGSYAGSNRGMYSPHHQSGHNGRHGNSRGRNAPSHRMDGGPATYGYNPYGNTTGRQAAYSSPRGRAVPVTPEYLNAQAAAAAAAAAAAVYQSNGVHLNGTAAFAPMRSSSGPAHTHLRGMGPRNNVRGGDSRRSSGGSHQDGYGRGPVSGLSRSTGSSGSGNQDRGLLERNGGAADGSGGGSGLKFSSFSDVVGRAEELARDQHGCRFLQTKLEEGNAVYINSIFEECYEKFVDLMTDPFGNYLCQKLFEFCNDAQRLALVERCAPAIPHVSTNMHGTRAVQRMVECLSTTEQVEAVCNALRPAAVSLMKDINGNHVIQRCLNRMDPGHNQFVYDAVAGNCFELATHRHGCCVMQRCMDFASPMQRNQLAQQINANALPLVQNAFGNYVVQYVLELNDPVYTAEIIRRLRGHLAELSMQKFSSNVVEKGLQLGSRETRRELIDELISDQETMRRLLHDAYGNYVIQRALQIAEGPQLERICEAIRPHLNSLKQSPYGKRIQAKILKRMPKGIPPLPPSS